MLGYGLGASVGMKSGKRKISLRRDISLIQLHNTNIKCKRFTLIKGAGNIKCLHF